MGPQQSSRRYSAGDWFRVRAASQTSLDGPLRRRFRDVRGASEGVSASTAASGQVASLACGLGTLQGSSGSPSSFGVASLIDGQAHRVAERLRVFGTSKKKRLACCTLTIFRPKLKQLYLLNHYDLGWIGCMVGRKLYEEEVV